MSAEIKAELDKVKDKKLTELDLKELIEKVLAKDTSLKTINLANKEISELETGLLAKPSTDESRNFTDLCKVLETNTSVESMDLSYSRIDSSVFVPAVANLIKANHTLRQINLRGNKLDHDCGMTNILRMNDLFWILEALKSNTNLQSIDLSHNYIGELGAAQIVGLLKSNKNLRSLYLSKNLFNGNGLTTIFWCLTVNAFPASLLYGTGNTTLQLIDVSYNKMETTIARDFANMLKSNRTLQTIIAKGCDLGDKFDEDLSFDQVSIIADGLKQNKSVRALDLSDNRFGEFGCLALANALETNNTLLSLNLSGTLINSKAIEAFSRALDSNKVIREIILDNCQNVDSKLLAEMNAKLKRNQVSLPFATAYEQASNNKPYSVVPAIAPVAPPGQKDTKKNR